MDFLSHACFDKGDMKIQVAVIDATIKMVFGCDDGITFRHCSPSFLQSEGGTTYICGDEEIVFILAAEKEYKIHLFCDKKPVVE